MKKFGKIFLSLLLILVISFSIITMMGCDFNDDTNTETNKIELTNGNYIVSIYSIDDFMILDSSTRRNLELTETMRDKNKRGSLLWVLDKCKTAMGSRMLRNWIENPLVDISKISMGKYTDGTGRVIYRGHKIMIIVSVIFAVFSLRHFYIQVYRLLWAIVDAQPV